MGPILVPAFFGLGGLEHTRYIEDAIASLKAAGVVLVAKTRENRVQGKRGGGVLRQRNITMRGRSMLGDRPSVNTVHQVVDCSEQEKGQIHLPPPSPLPPCLTVGRIYVRKHPSLDAFRATICTYVLGRRTSWNWRIILSLVRLI